jgi:hypothetical protein
MLTQIRRIGALGVTRDWTISRRDDPRSQARGRRDRGWTA